MIVPPSLQQDPVAAATDGKKPPTTTSETQSIRSLVPQAVVEDSSSTWEKWKKPVGYVVGGVALGVASVFLASQVKEWCRDVKEVASARPK